MSVEELIQNRIGFNYVIMKIMEYEKKELSLEINSKFNVKEKLSHIYPKYLLGTKLSIFPDIYGNLLMLYLSIKELPYDLIEIIFIKYIEDYLIIECDSYDISKIFIIYILLAFKDNLDESIVNLDYKLVYKQDTINIYNKINKKQIPFMFDINFIQDIVSDLGYNMIERIMQYYNKKNIVAEIFKPLWEVEIYDAQILEYIENIHSIILKKYIHEKNWSHETIYKYKDSFAMMLLEIISTEDIRLTIMNIKTNYIHE